jgi:hypothetical protein
MPALLTTPAGGYFGERLIAAYPHQSPLSPEHPHLAMNLARSQENNIQQLAIDMLPQLVGRKCALWIAQHCAAPAQLLRSRNYVPPRTAFYCDWLKFSDEAAAGQFLQTWPRYDLQLQLRKVRAEYADRALKLERDLSLGHYDLARLPANKRWSAAKRYIAAHERQRKLEWDGKNLQLAAELSSTWSGNT